MGNRDIDNKLIENLGNSLAWIVMGVLEGKTEEFEFKERKLNNFFYFIQDEKKKAPANEPEVLIEEAKHKRVYIYESCKKVPYSQLLRLAEISPKNSSRNMNMKAYLQAGYCIIGVWIDSVLKEHYRMSIDSRKRIFEMINDWIDSYQKGYLSNKGINEMFIEDVGYDLARGEKV